MPIGSGVSGVKPSRADAVTQAQGFIAETFPRAACPSASVPTSGDLDAAMLPLQAGDVVTNLHFVITVVATAPTLVKVALYDLTGVRLGFSADVSGTYNATGTKTVALTTPYTSPTTQVVYASLLQVAGTCAALARGINIVAGELDPVGTGKAGAARQTGLADLPTPAVFANFFIPVWFGVS